jgi:hypothetical protein
VAHTNVKSEWVDGNLVFKDKDGATIATFDGANGTLEVTGNIGFFGTSAASQPSAYTQTYATANKTIAAPTAAALTVSDGAGTNDGTIGAITGDASVIAAVQELADQINKLVADTADTKQAVNSIIDDLQSLGLAL